MKKEILVVLLLCLSIAKSQPILRQGWPIHVFPQNWSENTASAIVLNSESDHPLLLLKGGARVVSTNMNGELIDYYSSISSIGLRGHLVPLHHSDTSLFRIATVTQPFSTIGCTLIVGRRGIGDIVRIQDSLNRYFKNPFSFDIDNDGIDELLVSSDSIFCYRYDMTQFDGFPIGYGVRTQFNQTSLAIARFPGYRNPLLFYQLNNYFHVREIGDSAEFPGFPIQSVHTSYGTPPVVFRTTDGFVVYMHHHNDQSGRIKAINQNAQILFDYGLGGDGWAALTMSLIDLEGDGIPELVIPCAARVPIMYTWNGVPIQIPRDSVQANWVGGAFGNAVGYRPPNHQTYWFYLVHDDQDIFYLIGREGNRILNGFPIPLVGDGPNIDPSLTLIPPVNDTLRIVIRYFASRFAVIDLPCQSGGVMECETAHHDYGRSGMYQPRTIPYSWINRPFKGELPKNHRLKVFPNPTNAQFTIYFHQDSPKKLIIYNSMGRNVGSILTHDQSKLNFDASHLSAGNYFIADEQSNSIPVTILK